MLFRHYYRLVAGAQTLQWPLLFYGGQQLLGTDQCHDLVYVAVTQGILAETVAMQLLFYLLGAVAEVNPAYFGPRRHNALDAALGQSQHLADHVAFIFGKALAQGALSFGHLFIFFNFLKLFLAAHQLEDGVGRPVPQGFTGLTLFESALPQLVEELDHDGETYGGI